MPRLLLLSLVALCLACPRQRVPSPSNDAPPDPNTPEAPDYPPDQRISYQPPYPEEPLGPRVDDAWAATALWLGGLRPGAAWSLVELRPDGRLVHHLDAAEGSLDLVKTPPIAQPPPPAQPRCALNGTWTAGNIAESHLVECRPAEYTLTLQCVDGSTQTIALTLDGPFIRIDKTCQTSMRGIYAIGDVTGEPMLAHRAMAQGEMVAEHIAGHAVEWDKRAIPAVCFTDPEVVACGAAPGEIEGTSFASFPLQANGRALTAEREDGFIRVVWRDSDHAVAGLQAVGAGVSELSASFALAIEMGACLEDIGATIHAHPTQSEALHEACLRALGQALHI